MSMNEEAFSQKKWLYIPMEIIERELYPKLFLATEVLKGDWCCVLGTKAALLAAADQLPKGLVYLKSVIPSEYNNMLRYKEFGHRLVCLDEEGLIQSSLETLVTARYNEKTVAEAEKFYCWGDVPRDALREHYKKDAEKFITTGSPTADLWTLKSKEIYKSQIAALHEKYGKYIMIPSSFAVANHFMGPEEALNIMKRDNMFRDEADYQYYKEYHDYVDKVFKAFLKLLPVLSKKFPDYSIILRPHPSDNQQVWRDETAALENIHVVFDGPVSPWLAGADAVLHWGSTTGLEAYLVGKPVVGHTPLPEEEKAYDVLPHWVSIMSHSEQEVLENLQYVLNHPDDWKAHYPQVQSGHEALKRWIGNLENGPAIQTLVREFESLNVEPQSFNGQIKRGMKRVGFKEAVWRGIELFAKLPFFGRFFSKFKRLDLGLKSREFGRHKTGYMHEAYVREGLSQLSDMPFTVTELSESLYCISKEKQV
jgi:surface carbohydrate biosynthesis protein